MKTNVCYFNAAIKQLLFWGVLVFSTQVSALPQSWIKYLECTRSYEKLNKPGGHFETVVAEKVYYNCSVNAPDPFRTTDEFGPPRAFPSDSIYAADVPCSEIPSVIDELGDKNTELTHQITALKNDIASGNSALAVTDATTAGLKNRSDAFMQQCQVKKNAYYNALQKKIRSLSSICQRMSREKRVECFDNLTAEADESLAVIGFKDASDLACNLSSIAEKEYSKSNAVGNDLRSELNSWNNQLVVLQKAKTASLKKLKTLRLLKNSCSVP